MLSTLQIKLETNDATSLSRLSSTTILLSKRSFCQSQEDFKLVIKKDNNNDDLKELEKNNT